jgi:ubiquinone/menaquinone biosynthesis C-methylase UbiE
LPDELDLTKPLQRLRHVHITPVDQPMGLCFGGCARQDLKMSHWPKVFPPLTAEQQEISNDFMKHWHEVLAGRIGIVDRFNHGYPVKTAPQGFLRTLEVGAGLGEHLKYENLSPEQRANYYAFDIRENMIAELKRRLPDLHSFVGDCQGRLDFADGYFDRILAIHVLEHLPNLPLAVREIHLLCTPGRGVFQVVIPCEGSLAYSLARRISAQRIFERRYKQSYRWFIEREHINLPDEILAELRKFFTVERRAFFPIPVPLETFNLCIGLNLKPRTF